MSPKGYKHLKVLSKGQATTCLAESKDGQEVVIKTLELKNVSSWKGIELFEREVNVLRQLDHPSIPKFIDFVKDEHEGAKRWHIVQEKVEGKKLDPTKPWSEDDLRELAKSVLESLVYLQSFSPPLLHRDVKPDNLIRKEKGYALIDFGSVRHVIPSDLGGSTVVGTSGYMAPEQLMGRADTSSDLYGLGMTLIHLISGKHPDALEKKRMQTQWSEYKGKLSEEFIDFVNQLTEAHAENRFENAEEALDVLIKPIGPPKNLIRNQKSWVKISWNQERDMIRVHGTSLKIRQAGEFAPFLIFFSLLFFFMSLKAIAEFQFAAFLGTGFFLFLLAVIFMKIKRINATIQYTNRGIEKSGIIGDDILSKPDQRKLDEAVQELSLRWLDEKSKSKQVKLESRIEEE